ncbi:MAG TPA: acyltransferase [Haliangiales bacterium]|nr:acyltransferase [Haliangiales bacterium]
MPSKPHDVAIGYLRSVVTVLVLAHHAVLAYHPYAPPPQASLSAWPQLWRAFPVVDAARWPGFAWLVGFNDVFFMALMFFVSGLYAWRSLERKGSAAFVADRAVRLGLPFVAFALVIAPLAYYPAYLQTGASPSLLAYAQEWLAASNWPTGPAWFLWVLLAFDCLAAGTYALARGWVHARPFAVAARRPFVLFALLVAASGVAYVPLTFAIDPLHWTAAGPFVFQTDRLLHYAVYFFAGVVVGANRAEADVLAGDGRLARSWPVWVLLMAGAFALLTQSFLGAVSGSSTWAATMPFAFVLSCAASSFGFLAVFVRFARTSRRALDDLRDNAYGMYVVHYAFSAWLQFALLGAPLPGVAKGALAVAGTIALSWSAVAALRRIRAVARVIGPAVA